MNYANLKGADQKCKVLLDANTCKECYTGFVAVAGRCTTINALCKTYDTVSGACTSCYQGYTLNSSSGCQLASASLCK